MNLIKRGMRLENFIYSIFMASMYFLKHVLQTTEQNSIRGLIYVNKFRIRNLIPLQGNLQNIESVRILHCIPLETITLNYLQKKFTISYNKKVSYLNVPLIHCFID